MNQNDQMREALRGCVETMQRWRMCELGLIAGPTEDEIEAAINRADQALAAEPDKLEVRKILVSAHNAFVALSGLTQNSTALHVIKEQSRQLKVALAKHGGTS